MLTIITYPDPRLTRRAVPLVDFDMELRTFVQALEATMRSGPPSVGIAAPQVGRAQRIAIVDVSGKPGIPTHGRVVLINPEITRRDGSVVGREGCLSVPDYTGNVMRAATIDVDSYDEHGARMSYTFTGFEARAVQHEIDHLDGMLFLDRLVSRRNDLFRRKVYK